MYRVSLAGCIALCLVAGAAFTARCGEPVSDEARAKALAEGCREKDHEGNLLPAPHVIAEYQSVRKPDLAKRVESPGVPLRRAMSLGCFVTYHLNSAIKMNLDDGKCILLR